jgi:nickel-dependent lactate racemase
MRISLRFGRQGLNLNLPDDIEATQIHKYPMTPLPNPSQAVKDALRNPIGSPSLVEIAKAKKSACILVCDITRPVPNGILLPPLLETLEKAGIAQDNVLILVATGLHRPNEKEELREIIGSDKIFSSVRIENHLALDREAHTELGETTGGTPIMIDRRFVEADLKIVTGLVEPHFMAGYSGGRKVVAPGVAYKDTILNLHAARILENCNATNCIMRDNPLHDEQIEIVRKIGGILSLNVVIDEYRHIAFVNFGEIEKSHQEAVEFIKKHAEVAVPSRFKIVITTSAGYPLDRTYYQTIKGMVGVLEILEPGGTIIIASECSEGFGSFDFRIAQRLLCEIGPDRFIATIHKREKARIDEWQTEMLVKALRLGKIQLFTNGLSQDDLKDIFVDHIASIEEAVLAGLRFYGDYKIAIVPEGPYVIPIFKKNVPP